MYTARGILEQLKELKDETLNDSTRALLKEEDESPIRDSLLDRSQTGIPELSLSNYLDPDTTEEEEESPIRCGSTVKAGKKS